MIITSEIRECTEEFYRKYGCFNRRAFLRAGIDLTAIDGEYAELVGERLRWLNLELEQDCYGIGWEGEGYGAD